MLFSSRNRLVNMVFIEAPVGVGFSYSDNNNYKCDDDRTASENLAGIETFFSLYPEFKNNKFFITGESYAGVYVPTLAEAIVKAELAGTYTGAKLTGIAVGNGCSGTEVGICGSGPQGTYYEWQYLLSTSFVDPNLKNTINSECNWDAAAKNEPDALSFKCVTLLNQASAQISHVNMYDIYGDCVDNMCSAGEDKPKGKVPVRPMLTATDASYGKAALGRIVPHGPDACIDSGTASAYLNRADVQAAIHVRNPGFCWAVCNTAPGWSYKSTRTNLPKDTYPLLVSNIQVTIYNGDWDACKFFSTHPIPGQRTKLLTPYSYEYLIGVPYTDAEGWTQSMGYTEKTAWHPWTYTSSAGNTNQVAGYAVVYDVSGTSTQPASGSNSFSLVIVKGGRHEVPESAPAQAFEMLTRVIEGKSF
ncbi:hypothetical protein EON65_15585 [archaeon]|nr:MAG: hypothetical protein EON65_15585 [archaeon]